MTPKALQQILVGIECEIEKRDVERAKGMAELLWRRIGDLREEPFSSVVSILSTITVLLEMDPSPDWVHAEQAIQAAIRRAKLAPEAKGS